MKRAALAVPALALALARPAAAQTWDLRLEVPRPEGQSLPQTFLSGTGQLASGSLDTGRGYIATVGRTLFRVGPVLRFTGAVEYAHWKADGTVQQGGGPQPSFLRQSGLGAGVHAEFWIPFTGLAGEMGVVQRFQDYRFETAGAAQDTHVNRTWLRVGARWRLPFPVVHPYLAASYQQPVTKDRPVKVSGVSDLQGYLTAQGSGQEFDRMWAFGVGLTF